MSTLSPAVAVTAKRSSRRQHLFLLVTTITIAVAVLTCPFTQDALSKTPSTRFAAPAAQLFGRTVLAGSRTALAAVSSAATDRTVWHTEGSRIVSSTGAPVRIAGVNWSGFETTNMVPGGLKIQDYRSILRNIHAAGYNTVRIPFSNQMVESPIVPTNIAFENAEGEAINRDLSDLDSMQILDHIVSAAGEAGLKVILDNHRSEAGSSAEANGLWYTAEYPESAWIADWTALAARYKGNPAVIGFDLRNEPHNATNGGSCWSCNSANDWHLAAQRAGNAILRVNASVLIFVEGTDTVGSESDFWGGNLSGVRTAPVRLAVPGRLVYSAHVYGPTEYQQSWFNAATTPATLAALYHRHWGFISEAGIAPVWIGEFGTPNNDVDVSSTEPGSEGQWFQAIVAYLGSHPSIGWTYWGINGEDRYGLLDAAYNSTPANTLKAQALASIRRPAAAAAAFETASTGAQPTGTRTAFTTAPQPIYQAPTYPALTYQASTNQSSADQILLDRAAIASTGRTVRKVPVHHTAATTADAAVESSVAEQVRLATARALRVTGGQAE